MKFFFYLMLLFRLFCVYMILSYLHKFDHNVFMAAVFAYLMMIKFSFKVEYK